MGATVPRALSPGYCPRRVLGQVQAHHPPLGASADGSGTVEQRGRPTAAGQNELGQRRQLGVKQVNFPLHLLHVLISEHAHRARGEPGHGEVGADPEEFVLHAMQQFVDVRRERLGPDQPEHRIEFVDRAAGFNVRIVLGDPGTATEMRPPIVALAGINLHEHRPRSASQLSPCHVRSSYHPTVTVGSNKGDPGKCRGLVQHSCPARPFAPRPTAVVAVRGTGPRPLLAPAERRSGSGSGFHDNRRWNRARCTASSQDDGACSSDDRQPCR